MLFSGTDGACADSPRKSWRNPTPTTRRRHLGYLEAWTPSPQRDHPFTPQPYFLRDHDEWAATLQDLVEQYRTTVPVTPPAR
jgi:hypothetical protein